MRSLLQTVGWAPGDVQLVAVARGPGSFTGLRVGVTTAKVFAYAVGAAVLGVDTLEVIAAAAPPAHSSLCVIVDAQRGDVVAGWFQRGADGWFEPLEPAQLVPVGQWASRLTPGTAVSGPALRRYAAQLPPEITVLDEGLWSPRAANVGRLAARLYAAGRRDDLWALVPHYSRRSAAEEKKDNATRQNRP